MLAVGGEKRSCVCNQTTFASLQRALCIPKRFINVINIGSDKEITLLLYEYVSTTGSDGDHLHEVDWLAEQNFC